MRHQCSVNTTMLDSFWSSIAWSIRSVMPPDLWDTVYASCPLCTTLGTIDADDRVRAIRLAAIAVHLSAGAQDEVRRQVALSVMAWCDEQTPQTVQGVCDAARNRVGSGPHGDRRYRRARTRGASRRRAVAEDGR